MTAGEPPHPELVEARALSIAGVVPREVVAPRSIDELVAIVQALHAERRAFAFVGGGTELELGNPPRALDTVIRTNALQRVVDYAPEDQTITVEAGMTFAQLDRVLAEHGQMLPLDVPDRERSTVGGVVATNAYGARRQRYGTAKDLIVGVEIVRPDGTRARGGGKVVKNVAGFDIPKLMVGSLGTLGAITAATLRVHPIPETGGAIRLASDRPEATKQLAAGLIRRRLEPAAVIGEVVVFEGVAAGVAAQLATANDLARELSLDATVLDEAGRAEVEGRDLAARTSGAWRIKQVSRPTDSELAASGLSYVPGGRVETAYPLLGVRFVSFDDAPHVEDAYRDGVRNLTGGTTVFHAIPLRLRGTIDAWGPPPKSFPLMRAIKEHFDPLGLCNPGRFVGGL
jgi:glycolate oxidase FAD binding subunit